MEGKVLIKTLYRFESFEKKKKTKWFGHKII